MATSDVPLLIYCPSKIANRTLLPAKHHVTKIRNVVSVGSVSIGNTARETIKQPVYLRKGYGIYFRKFQAPRRDHYGSEQTPDRLEYHPESRVFGEYSGALARTLYTPGVLMTSQPICLDHLGLLGSSGMLNESSQGSAEGRSAYQEAIQDQRKTFPDLRRVGAGRQGRMLGPLLPKSSRICFFDQENRKPPPAYFIPPRPLPGPEKTLGSDSMELTTSFTRKPLLRVPRAPVIQMESSTITSPPKKSSRLSLTQRASFPILRTPSSLPTDSPSSTECSNISQDSEMRPPTVDSPILSHRRNCVPISVPRVQIASVQLAPRTLIKVSSSRVQPPLVNLGDVFPYGAEQGLLAEIDFYRQNNFPLLITRNADVDLKSFTALTSIRMLPPERVTRVDALTKTVTRLRALNKETKVTDPDVGEERLSYIEDKVFNPLSYPFNEDVYKEIKKMSKMKKL